LQSDILALEVIRQLNLDNVPRGRHRRLAAGHGVITTDPLTADSSRVTSMLGAFRGGLHIVVIPNTRIIEIHYICPDKNLAAAIVNTLAMTYKEANYRTKFESTMQALTGSPSNWSICRSRSKLPRRSWCATRKSMRFSAPTKSKTSSPANSRSSIAN